MSGDWLNLDAMDTTCQTDWLDLHALSATDDATTTATTAAVTATATATATASTDITYTSIAGTSASRLHILAHARTILARRNSFSSCRDDLERGVMWEGVGTGAG